MSVRYAYSAKDSAGRVVRGTRDAQTEREVYTELVGSGLEPLSIKPRRGSAFGRLGRGGGRPIASESLSVFARELSITLDAGVSLPEGLASIAESEEDPRLREAVASVSRAVRSGVRLGDAMRQHTREFGDLFVEMMVAAERTGDLKTVASDLADLLERREQVRKGVRRAMAYPIVVLCFISLALSVITFFVVPRFAEIFESNGVELPLLTRVLRSVGVSVTSNPVAYAVGTAAAVIGAVLVARSGPGRGALGGIIGGMPYFGRLVRYAASARFCRVLSVSVSAGLDVIQSIQIAAGACGNARMTERLQSVVTRMRSGQELDSALRSVGALPAFAVRLLSAGHDAKEVGRAAGLLSKHFDRETDGLTKNISTVVEPLMTVGMAVIVLVVALSVFVPMWGMIRAGA
ncbi:MAG: type II secretion system F family protein [Phycisphaerales bacterium JB040]